MSTETEIEQLLLEASELPATNQKVELLEKAVRLLESHGESEDLFKLKIDLSRTAMDAGLPEKALVLFSEILQSYDQSDVPPVSIEEFLWIYRDYIVDAGDIPAISLDQLNHLMDDLERRLTDAGIPTTAAIHTRWRVLMRTGHLEEAQSHLHQWYEMVPSVICYDWASCIDSVFEFHCLCDAIPEAFEIAEPVLTGEYESRPIVPALTFCRAILCGLQMGEIDIAKKYLNLALKEHQINRQNEDQSELFQSGFWIVGLACTGNVPEALRLFQKHLKWAIASTNLDNIGLFYVSIGALLVEFSETQKVGQFQLPPEFSVFRVDDGYDTLNLGKHFLEKAFEIAAQFDKRNGNQFRSLEFQLRVKLVQEYFTC